MATKCGRKVHDSLQMMIIELVFYSNHKARIFKTWLLYRVQAGDRCKIKNSNEKKTSENKYVPLKGKQATSVINSPCLNKRIGKITSLIRLKKTHVFPGSSLTRQIVTGLLYACDIVRLLKLHNVTVVVIGRKLPPEINQLKSS